MRAYGGGRGVTDLPTTVRGPSVFGIAARSIYLLEVGVFNTTTSAFAAALVRATAAGTPSGSVTETSEDSDVTPVAVVSLGNSGTPTVGGSIVQASIGAAIGAGVIWTFGGKGLRAPAGTANGFVITCPTGTAQFFDFYFVWEE